MRLGTRLLPARSSTDAAAGESYRAETRKLTAHRIPVGVLIFCVPIACLSVIDAWYHPERIEALATAFLSYTLMSLVQLLLVRQWPALSVPVTVVVVNCLEIGLCSCFGAVGGATSVLVFCLILLVAGVAVLYPWGLSAQLAASAGVLVGYPMALALGATQTVRLPFEVLALLTAVGVAGFGAYVLDAHRFMTFQQSTVSRALLDVARSLAATLCNPNELARQVADHARWALGADWVMLFQLDPETRKFQVSGCSQAPESFVEDIRCRDFPASFDPESRRSLQETGSAERWVGDPGDPKTALALGRWNVSTLLMQAIKRGQEMVGVINCYYTARRPSFDTRERELLAAIANQASVALENARLMEEARHANRVKSEFVATLSHELRTPLGVIMGYADLLLDGTCDPTEEEGRGLLRRMRQQAGELNDLVQGLLDVTRMETRRLALDVGPFSIGDLVADVSGSLPAGWRKDCVALQWQIRDPATLLQSDRRKAAMILRNLIHNALKYTAAGSVTVSVQRNEDEHRVMLTVSDTGPGIPQAEQAAIFEMFRQSAGVPRKGDGVGLGLYIVKRMTEALGGQISLDSREGVGSRFSVCLPVDAPSGVPSV